MRIIAFDPGKKTSWARFDTTKPHLMEVGDVDSTGIGRLVRPCAVHMRALVQEADIVLVEEVSSRPSEGVASVFTFGMAFGGILAAAQGAEKSLRTVTPAQWSAQLRMKAGASKEEKKAAAVAYVKELWPGTRDMLRIKSDHNRADAALMIRWFFEKGPGRDVRSEDELSPPESS